MLRTDNPTGTGYCSVLLDEMDDDNAWFCSVFVRMDNNLR